jgi:hypothetical protein
MSRIKEDGYEEVTIETPDGGEQVVKIDSYLLGLQIHEAAQEHKAAGGANSEWAKKVRAILKKNGMDLSTKAALDAADAIQLAMGEDEKKSEATPPAE